MHRTVYMWLPQHQTSVCPCSLPPSAVSLSSLCAMTAVAEDGVILPTVVNKEDLTGVTDGVVEDDDKEVVMARNWSTDGPSRWTIGTVMAK